MNPIVLGLGGAFLITLGLASGIAPAALALACIDDRAETIVMSEFAMTVDIDDSVPCP